MKRVLFAIVFVIPFIIGSIGYYLGGQVLKDSMYYSLTLYVMSLNYESLNILTEIARWTAPIMTASGLILAIKSVFFRIRDQLVCFQKDATVVYGDGKCASMVQKGIKHSILSTAGIKKHANSHIIMFENDMDNVSFYQANEDYFKNKDVYLHLKKMDSYLLKESTVHFFNPYEIIARKYWENNHLIPYLKSGQMQIDIAIIGFGELGQRLLQYGLLNNIYSLDQKITYHIFGDSTLYEKTYQSFDMMNGDAIIYHGKDWEDHFDAFLGMERVILTEIPDLRLVQSLLHTCKDTKIDYYCDGNIRLEALYKSDVIHGFGNANEVYTEENIKTNHLYQAAMELNYKYETLYGEVKGTDKQKEMTDLWNSLDGFTKGSNIASADYHTIRCMVMEERARQGNEMSREELAEGEHIRWCRFHYLNHWSYGVPANGKNKDPKQKIHKCLVAFNDLPEEEKQKDVETVELLLELFQ